MSVPIAVLVLYADIVFLWRSLILMYRFTCFLFRFPMIAWAMAQTPVASVLFDLICGGGSVLLLCSNSSHRLVIYCLFLYMSFVLCVRLDYGASL